MDMKKILWVIILLGMLTCAGLIIGYYWMVRDLQGITKLPIPILIITLLYIVLQILKRNALKVQNWWDWTYYIGLISILIPIVLGDAKNEVFYHLLTDYGTFFLVFPILLDGYKIFYKK